MYHLKSTSSVFFIYFCKTKKKRICAIREAITSQSTLCSSASSFFFFGVGKLPWWKSSKHFDFLAQIPHLVAEDTEQFHFSHTHLPLSRMPASFLFQTYCFFFLDVLSRLLHSWVLHLGLSTNVAIWKLSSLAYPTKVVPWNPFA